MYIKTLIYEGMKSFIEVLNKRSYVDFIYGRPKRSAALCFAIVFFSLYFLDPLNLEVFPLSWKIGISFVYATIPVSLYLLIFALLQGYLSSFKRRWTYKVEALFFVGVLLLASGLAYLYTYLMCNSFGHFELTQSVLKTSLYYSFVLGALIYVVLKLLDNLAHIRDQISNNSERINTKLEKKVVVSGNNINEEIIALKVSSILFFESDGNHIQAYFKDNNDIRTKTIKKTLKEIETEFVDYKEFFRCHKGFIINKDNINEIRGNSRVAYAVLSAGYKIPISRTKFLDLKKNFLAQESVKQ
ncbi:LytR/AlgR family response regulator transcription factor [Spongiimicrobium sp. 3-5]|uniref:LytR/AlgR family response regulator transcription factor n=1 Tax=Spongiimicrobium sp. 3-5 TaxID=3332596 RepID=UPI00397EAA13